MDKILNKMCLGYCKAKCKFDNFLNEERGDTNFISIAIILIIVVALALVFIKFKSLLLPKLEKAYTELLGALG